MSLIRVDTRMPLFGMELKLTDTIHYFSISEQSLVGLILQKQIIIWKFYCKLNLQENKYNNYTISIIIH